MKCVSNREVELKTMGGSVNKYISIGSVKYETVVPEVSGIRFDSRQELLF